MKLAVALLTCDRIKYTRCTVETLLKQNDTSEWSLFYADDASKDDTRQYVESRGFEPLVLNDDRQGCSPTTEALVHAIRERCGDDALLLYLQNDFECCRPLPVAMSEEIASRHDCGFLQLAYRRPRSRYNRRITFLWPDGETWAFGDTSRGDYVLTPVGFGVGYHPTIARVRDWCYATEGVKTEKQFVRRNASLGKRIYRYPLPVFRHIGRRTTPHGLFGRRRRNRRNRVGQARYDVPPVDETGNAFGEEIAPGKALEYYPEDKIIRTAWQAGPSLCSYLASKLRPGMKTLECGSGLTTWLFFGACCNHEALEHSRKYAPPLQSVLVRPLTGKPPWYDWEPSGGCYDLILIDGPPSKKGRRHGILRVVDRLVGPETVIVLDDTNRASENALADKLQERFGMQRTDVPAQYPMDNGRTFSVLEPQP
jgi:hypothetical protein